MTGWNLAFDFVVIGLIGGFLDLTAEPPSSSCSRNRSLPSPSSVHTSGILNRHFSSGRCFN